MTKEQFDKLQGQVFEDKTLTPEEFFEFVINGLMELNPKGDLLEKYRDSNELFYLPLVYGYNTNRETFSVNIYQGTIEVSEGKNIKLATCLEDCIPNKRAYPQETDYFFALLCRQHNSPICFGTF